MSFDDPSAQLTVNGTLHQIAADPTRRLSDVLREELGLFGTKIGCDAGDCGACTVLLDGAPVCACLVPSAQALGRAITTVEGLATPEMSRLQNAFLRHGAAQCGICTPGMMMAAEALLAETPHPTRAEAKAALGGVLCRCTGYSKILDAVCDAAPAKVDAKAPPVGQPIERLDGPPKVLGTDVFGADHRLADWLAVRAVRSPYFAATFAFDDLDAWRAQYGLTAVLTAADIPGLNRFGVIPPFADQPTLADGHAPVQGGSGRVGRGPA